MVVQSSRSYRGNAQDSFPDAISLLFERGYVG